MQRILNKLFLKGGPGENFFSLEKKFSARVSCPLILPAYLTRVSYPRVQSLYQYIPPIEGSTAGAGVFSLISATSDSVVSTMLATDAAF